MMAEASSPPLLPNATNPHREPTPHRLSSRSSRSPKRVKQTPSPNDALSGLTPGPSRSRNKINAPRRPPMGERRGVTFDGHATTSPFRSGDAYADGWGLSGRRREMSVPLLSQTLSHFSLSQSSPPIVAMQTSLSATGHQPTPPNLPLHQQTPSSSFISKTPQRHPAMTRTPNALPLQKEHVYPSTAPLPHLPTFLGSPFSTKTSRGRYLYDTSSPSKGVMTEHIGQNAFGQLGLDWRGGSEWMAEQTDPADGEESETEVEHEAAPSTLPQAPIRSRRDTSGSTSSLDDFSGSGTSSSSLLSLGRTSMEHHVRPSFITIWGEEREDLDIHDDPATPSRQLFSSTGDVEGVLQMSAKTARASPGLSPLIGKTASLRSPGNVSPLQHFLLSHSPGNQSPNPRQPSPTSAKPTRSSLSNLLPRLLSSSKRDKHSSPDVKTARSSRHLSPASCDAEDIMTDTEDTDSATIRARRRTPRSSPRGTSPHKDFTDSGPHGSSGRGIGLGIKHSVEFEAANSMRFLQRTTPFARSVSSESSSEIEPSPSKFLSARASAAKPSRSLTDATGTVDPITQARRKSMAAPLKAPLRNSPGTSSARPHPTRPALRRGITEPRGITETTSGTPTSSSLAVNTPFADIKPSPAAFASTGLIRKKSGKAPFAIPRFGQAVEAIKPISPSLPVGSTAILDLKDSLAYIKAAQKTRGLRRKGSTMFASGSSGSIGEIAKTDCTKSPATPTKPGFRVIPIGLGVTTPSPTSSTDLVYPFASSASSRSLDTPPSSDTASSNDGPILYPTDKIKTLPGRLRDLDRLGGPVARASNPMLASSFRSHGHPGSSGANPSQGISGRLERDFVMVKSIGSGEFSHVWKVKDKQDGRLWAVKAGKPYTGHKNRLRQLEEVSILRTFSLDPHPHIIDFIDSWEHNDRLYIRTELAECGDLSRFLSSLGDYSGLDEARVWKTLAELSSGLQHIHSHNVLHLDIKPSNILITGTGSLKIADFGMSTMSNLEGHAADLSPAIPSSGTDGGFLWTDMSAGSLVPSPILDREVEGDREYLSPEALGDGQVGREADVFSLGILLLEAAFNVVLPSNGDSWIKLRNNDFSDLSEHFRPRGLAGDEALPEISDILMETIKGMMASTSSDRMTLDEVMMRGPLRRFREMGGVEAALVEEEKGFLQTILGI